MISITRKFEFDYGHRVLGHEGKCASLHGHRGVAEVTVVPIDADDKTNRLDSLGRVIDFGNLKDIVGAWIDSNWDHCMILHSDDPLLTAHLHPNVLVSHISGVRLGELMGPRRPYVMKHNPTAENLAVELHNKVNELMTPHGLRCVNVRFHETPNCYADSKTSVTI